MVIGTLFTQFNNRNSSMRDRSVPTGQPPLLNSLITNLQGNSLAKNTMSRQKKRLMKWYRENAPELTALVNMVAGDMAEESFFEPVTKSQSGRNKTKAAEDFALDINIRQQDVSTIIDILITGEGYGWIAQLTKQQVEDLVTQRIKELGLDNISPTRRLVYKANFSDEDLVRPRKYRYIASSTVENIYDTTSVLGFTQTVGADQKFYTPEEIIHYVFYDIDGRPEGFTPASTMVLLFDLLLFMWRNMHAQGRNGGQPDRIYAVEDVDINSPAFKRIEQELKTYVSMDSRHGSLLMNGKFNVIDLAQLDTMQYKEMGLYITGLLATQWRIPRSRISYIVDGTNTKDDTGGNSERAYWRNIEMLQDIYLSLQNKFLWIPFFGVKRKFKKAYKHDELIETQTQQQRLNNLTFMSNELAKNGMRLTKEYKLRYINGMNETIEDEDVEEIPKDETVMQDNSQFRQNLQSNQSLTRSSDSANKADKKRQEQESIQQTVGKPTGYGK